MEGEQINNSVTVESVIAASHCPTDIFQPLCSASRMKSQVSQGNLLITDNETAERAAHPAIPSIQLPFVIRGNLSVWKQRSVNRPSGSAFIGSCIVSLQRASTWTAVSSLVLPPPPLFRVITSLRLSKQTLRFCSPKGTF